MNKPLNAGASIAILVAALAALSPRLHTQSRGLPDLIVDQAALRQHWIVRTENLPADFCR